MTTAAVGAAPCGAHRSSSDPILSCHLRRMWLWTAHVQTSRTCAAGERRDRRLRWESLCQDCKWKTYGWNESAGGRGILRTLPISFFFAFLIAFLWFTLSTSPKKCDDCCFLGIRSCCCNSSLRDTPNELSFQRRGGGAYGGGEERSSASLSQPSRIQRISGWR